MSMQRSMCGELIILASTLARSSALTYMYVRQQDLPISLPPSILGSYCMLLYLPDEDPSEVNIHAIMMLCIHSKAA